MSKIEQNREKKRQAILKAAKENFLAEGYILANMDKIAKQASMTKQTVYRYFPSKEVLFKATLVEMGSHYDDHFFDHLAHPDTQQALLGFAIDFIDFHLSENHIATFRLLVTESAKAPEITALFLSAGPDETTDALSQFFSQRLDINNAEITIDLWIGMLLSLRNGVLIGMPAPTQEERKRHATQATNFLLSAITNNQTRSR